MGGVLWMGEAHVRGHQGETLVDGGVRGVVLTDRPGQGELREYSRAKLFPLAGSSAG